MKNFSILIIFCLFLPFSACANNEGCKGVGTTQTNETEGSMLSKNKKILIVYYSKTESTATIAKYIQEATGGTLLRINPVTPYPEDYRATTEQAKKEINSGYKPAIKAIDVNPKDYDVIFIGSPCWWATIAPPIATFLSENDLSNKTIIPFVTHLGSGMANNAAAIAKLAPKATMLDGKAFRGNTVNSAKEEVMQWVKGLKL